MAGSRKDRRARGRTRELPGGVEAGLAGLATVLFALLLAVPSLAAPPGDNGLDLGVKRQRQKAGEAAEVVFVEDRHHVAVFELTGNYDKLLGDGTSNHEPRRLVAQRFYETHSDSYDFLLVFTTFEFETGADVQAFYIGVRNDVLGIGTPVFDSSDLYGSAGRLQGYIDMAAMTRYELDRTKPAFDFLLGTAAHEILHRWAVRIDGALGDRLLKSDRAHWSFLVDTDGSLMYGNDWRPNGDGTFTSVAIRKLYNPLELYLAGFAGPEEVPPFFVVDDPTEDPDRLPELGAVVEGAAEVVTIDDVVAANGPRIPAAEDAPREFRAAILLLQRPGEEIDGDLLGSLEQVRQGVMDRLPILTGGRALIEIEPEGPDDVVPGAPTPVEGGAPREGEASLAEALTWLRAEQRPEGYWQDTPATRPRDTSVAASVLGAFDPAFAGGAAAAVWLGTEGDANIDALARAVRAMELLGAEAIDLRAELLALRNADGGWGLATKRASDPLDTALAMAALPGQEGVLTAATAFLVAGQNADGGWGNHPGGASRTSVTSEVARVLAERADVPAGALTAAAAYLASKQNADGGFGDSPSTAHDTANALLALQALGAEDVAVRSAATSFLRSRQGEDGSWAGSRYATALVIEALQVTAGFSDYSFAAPLTAEPAALRDGERARLEATVTNRGATPAPPTAVRFYEGDPAAGGEAFAEAPLASLGPGESETVTASWDSRDRPGTRTLFAVVDPDGAVDEISEADNTASVTVEVAAAPDGVDLAVGPTDLEVQPAAPDTLPATLMVSAQVHNVGTNDAGSVRVTLWQGEPSAGLAIASADVELAGRSTASVQLPATLRDPGTTLYTVEVDPEGTVDEVDESNNAAAVTVTTRPNVDLTVDEAGMTLVGGVAYLDLDAVFRVTVTNRGTLDAQADVRYVVTDGTVRETVAILPAVVAAGSSVEQEVPWRVDRLGDLWLEATVDPDSLVIEGDESNNTASLSFTATELLGVNLAVDPAGVFFDPDPALQGAPVRFSATVTNNGSAALTGVEVAFYEGHPDDGGVQVGAVQTIAEIGAGAAVEVSVLRDPPATALARVVYAIVDPADAIAEYDEDDNLAFRALPVLALPDLVLSPSAVTLTPPAPRPGEAVEVRVGVANLGGQTVGSVVLRLSDDATAQSWEQELAFVEPGEIRTASFDWTFPTSGGTVALTLEVDPDGAVPELSDANNVAVRYVAAATQGQTLSERYISPNGDGVRDSTVFFFSLTAPAAVEVEVTAAVSGAVVRRYGGAELDGVTAGSFEWDGRNDARSVVADGDYRLAAVTSSGEVASAVVTVDTNRSPFLDALGTPYESITNLTCKANFSVSDLGPYPALDLRLPPPYDRLFYRVYSSGIFWGFNGIYSQPVGGAAGLVLQFDEPRYLEVSDDAQKLAFRLRHGSVISGTTDGNYADADGSGLVTGLGNGRLLVRPGREDLIYYDSGQIFLRPMDGSGPERLLASDVGPAIFSDYQIGLDDVSPDGSTLLVRYERTTGRTMWLLDLDTGERHDLPLEWGGFFDPPADRGDGPLVAGLHHVWSPDSRRIAFVGQGYDEVETAEVHVFDRTGSLVRHVGLPAVSISELARYSHLEVPPAVEASLITVLKPSWGRSGTELVLGMSLSEYGDLHNASYGRIVRLNVETGETEDVAYLEPRIELWEDGEEGGGGGEALTTALRKSGASPSVAILTWNGSAWVERGGLTLANLYSEPELDVTAFLTDAAGEHRVRIVPRGEGAVHLERVRLHLGRGGAEGRLAPSAAARVDDGADVLGLVVRADHEVLPLEGGGIEVRWQELPDAALAAPQVLLAVHGRQESFRGLNVRPFFYPADDGKVYDYVALGGSPLRVDGLESADDALGEPLFSVFTKPGTGHPSEVVHGYAGSDEEHLYAALDFTVDNTLDGDADYAVLWVRHGGDWRGFRVSVAETAYGVAGFGYTGKVHHRHKYYEFRVPLAEIGAAPGDALELRFEAYGTAAEVVTTGPAYLPDDGEELLWASDGNRVLYTRRYWEPPWLIDLDGREEPRPVFEEFDTFSNPFLLDDGRHLLFGDDRDILNPEHPCYNGDAEESFFLFESAANLTAKLTSRTSTTAIGVVLEGTAADLHFYRYRLEYAAEEVPDFYRPIGEPSAQQVMGGVFTTWVPPHAGWYRVRLTVEDLAGNRRQAVHRLAFGDIGQGLGAIADLALAPSVFSPNGDGEKDRTTISYEVLQPVHLEFDVWNDRGERVRTITATHPQADGRHEVLWDGRDDDGRLVADGPYRVEVLGTELYATVDATAPSVEVSLTELSTGSLEPQLTWSVVDANLVGGVLEVGAGAEPQVWTELQATGLGTAGALDVDLEDYAGRRYRLRAEDAGGNLGIATSPLPPEQLIVHAFGVEGLDLLPLDGSDDVTDLLPEGLILPAPVRLAALETVVPELTWLYVEHRLEGELSWHQVAVAVPQQPRFEVTWDMAGVDLGGLLYFRLRAVDATGQEHLSNEMRLVTLENQSLRWRGRVRPEDLDDDEYGEALLAALDAVGLVAGDPRALWVTAESPDPIVDVSLIVEHDLDPRFLGGAVLAPVSAVGGVYLFQSELLPCTEYEVIAVGRRVEPTGETWPVDSGLRELTTPCFNFHLEWDPLVPECGDTAPPERRLAVTPKNPEGIDLRLLTVSLDEVDNVVWSVNAPVNDQVYTVTFPTADLSPGMHLVFVRLTDGEGEEVLRREPLAVDGDPPQVAITYPQQGQHVCTTGGATVEGDVTDVGYGLIDIGLEHNVGSSQIVALPVLEGPQSPVFHGPLAIVYDVDGEIRLTLSAIDAAGNRTCSETSFYLDGDVYGKAAASRRVFSPNGDGFADQVELSFNTGEPATVSAEIYRWVGEPVGDVLREFPEVEIGGSGQLIWDGRLGDGTIATDGDYSVVFSYRDACGNTDESWVLVGVDNTGPETVIVAPQGDQPLSTAIEVFVTVRDPHLSLYRLEWGVGAEPTAWTPLGQDTRPRTDERLATWNVFGLSGTFTLRLTAWDSLENVSATTVTLELGELGDLVQYFEAVPHLISPNGDGRRDAASLRYGLLTDTELTVTVVDPSTGATVRTLATGETTPPGSGLLSWNGLDDGGQPVADGLYKARLVAVSPLDPAHLQEESVSVVLDRVPPSVSLSRPRDGVATGDGAVVGSVDDEHLEEYRVSLADDPGAPQWTEIGRGTARVTDAVLAVLDDLADGAYALLLEADDAAGNESRQVVGFVVDNAPPAVSLAAPAAGAVLGAAQGPAAVLGTAEDEHPSSWRLEVGAGEAPAAWTELAAGTGTVPASPASWDVAGLADGVYTLRLRAEDLGGLTGEATVRVVVDNTPPAVAFGAPAAGYVTAPLAVTGTASDAHFEQYRLDLEPAGGPVVELRRGVSEVVEGPLFNWQVLPADGAYVLRLRATDRAGNQAETQVEVTLDTRPPAAPQGLTATLVPESDVRLDWLPVAEDDLAGYHVYRGSLRLTDEPVAAVTYLDPGLPEGTFTYTVTAVDLAGQESPPSQPAELTLDVTPPSASILAPRGGSVVSGPIDVVVTAFSVDDFLEYRLDGGETGGALELLARSPIPVRGEPAASWDTTAFAEGTELVLRLEAEDVHGNVGVAESRVRVDNLAPQTPTGLAASPAGADVEVFWDANSEADLAGYLLYRDGALVNAAGLPLDDLRPYAIAATAYTDTPPGDGTYLYTVAAIDEAGNVSPPSAAVSATLEQRAPRAVILVPDDGGAVDQATYVLARTEDRDVVGVVFETRAGGGAWTSFGTDSEEPWDATWDPAALGFAYGDYQLRAVATDDAGKTDAAPPVVTITYTDLRRPDAVRNLTALVDGGKVTLSWDAGGEADLAGYHVERTSSIGSTVRLTSTPLPGTSYVDTGLADAEYTYTVVAIDDYDNEADPSNEAEAEVYTPELTGPSQPTQAGPADLEGVARPATTVTATVTTTTVAGASTSVELAPVATDAEGRFTLPGVPIGDGSNAVSAVAADAAGNRSKPGVLTIAAGAPPAPPTGLTAVALPDGVDLAWDVHPAPEVVGYRVWRDGVSLNPLQELDNGEMTAEASSELADYHAAEEALNDYGSWWPLVDDEHPAAGQWWQARWSQETLVSRLEVLWDGDETRAVDYDVELWDGTSWQLFVEARDTLGSDHEIDLPQRYPTTGLRLVIRTATEPAYPGDPYVVGLYRVWVYADELVPAADPAFFDEEAKDGRHTYTVTAVHRFGFESAPSDGVEVGFGDQEPPEPVTLVATVDGYRVSLSWTASPAEDLWAYDVYRDGTLLYRIYNLDTLSFVDTRAANGLHTYQVTAVDENGNGAPSNEVVVELAAEPPPAPTDLTVTAPPRGDLLDLDWLAGEGPEPQGYRVLRSLVSGGPYETVAEIPTEGLDDPTRYRDVGLTHGVTYYYVVEAFDRPGNASSSNEAAGTPIDRLKPGAPVLYFPGPPGLPSTVESLVVPRVLGASEAGARVEVFRDGVLVGYSEAGATEEWTIDFESYAFPVLSPDGRYLVTGDGGDVFLFTVDDSSATLLPGLELNLEEDSVVWMPDSERLLVSRYDWNEDVSTLFTYRVADGAVEELAVESWIAAAVPSPDGRRLAVLADRNEGAGLFLYEPETGTWTLLLEGALWDFRLRTLQWSVDGRLAFLRNGRIEVLEPETGELQVITEVPGWSEQLDFSPDGSALVYTAPDAEGWEQIAVHRFADGTDTVLTSGRTEVGHPRFLADGTAVVYVHNNDFLYRQEIAGGEAVPLASTGYYYEFVDVVETGLVVLLDNERPKLVRPGGQFELTDLALHAGENRLTARATDLAGNVGPTSEPKVFVVDLGLPDLVAGELRVLPPVALTGETVRVAVAVRNDGGVASPAGELDLRLFGDDGSVVELASGSTVPPLAPGASQELEVEVTLAGGPGPYTVVAVVDPRARIAEADEDNNRAERRLMVRDEGRQSLFAATDREVYGGREDVEIRLEAANGGDDFSGRIDVRVEDENGYLVEELPSQPIDLLRFGETLTLLVPWSTGDYFAGAYRVRGLLFGAAGSEVATALARFEIRGGAQEVETSVITGRPVYVRGESVRVTGTVSYLAGNSAIHGAVAVLSVATGGVTVAEHRQTLGELLVGATGTVTFDWPSDGAAGIYSASFEVRLDEQVLRRSETSFELLDEPLGTPELRATKTDQWSGDLDGNGVVSPGDELRYEIVVTNDGTAAASEVVVHDLLPVTVALVVGSVETDRGLVVSEEPVEVAIGGLEPGESATVGLTVTIAPETKEVVNQATVTSAELPAVLSDDPDLGGGADPTVTAVSAAPVLVAEKTVATAVDADGDGTPSPGDTLRYTVTLRNVGGGPATGVAFADEVPQHTTLVPDSIASSAGTVEETSPILVAVGSLAADAEPVVITFDVVIDDPIAAGVGEITNQGLVVSDQLDDLPTDDPALGGESDPTVTTVTAAPALRVEKTASLFADSDADGLVSPGDELLYRIEVRNTGNTGATGVVLSDPLGDHLSLVAGTVQTSQGTVVGEPSGSDPLTVDLGTVAAGTEPAAVTFRVRIADPFPWEETGVSNQASVTSAELDPVPSDDPGTEPLGDATVTEVFVTGEASIDDVTVGESDGTAVFTVSLASPGNHPATLSYATADPASGLPAAAPGGDYEPASGELSIPAGSTSATVSVAVHADTLDEPDESFTVQLSNPQHVRLGDAEGLGTIVDDDDSPSISIDGVTVGESDGAAVFTLTLTTESGFDTSVGYATADATASAPGDYVAASGTATIPAGSTTASIAVTVVGDALDELDESFTVELSNPQHVVIAGGLGVGTIVDDDEALISIDDVTVDEGAAGITTDAVFTVSLATEADREIRVDYVTVAGPSGPTAATEGEDYLATSGTLVFPAFSTEQTVAVTVVGDQLLEELEETYTVELSNAVETTLLDGTGLGIIRDDELCPGPNLLVNPGAEDRVKDGVIPGWTPLLGDDWQVSGADPEPYEGAAYFDAGQSEMAELYQDVDVRAYGARIAAGDQLFAFSGRVRTRDETPPDVARIVVEYRDASNAVVLEAFNSGEIANPYEWQEVADVRAAPVGTGWIRVRLLATRFTDEWNDGYFDALALASRRTAVVTIDDVEVYEGHAGTTEAVFTVALSCPYEYEVAGSFATAEGTALAGEDYLAVEGGFSIPAGETDFEITVPVIADEEDEEPVESFTVELGELQSDGSPVLLDGSGRGDIKNDDFCPLGPGYWKNHREDWVVEELRIGGVWYDDEAMMEHLRYGGPDASSRLARHLVATLLNLARGSDPFILPAVQAADAFLAAFPPGSDPRGEDRDEANGIKDLLDDYNNLPCEKGGGGGGNGHGNGKGGR